MTKEQRLQTIQTTEKALELLRLVTAGEQNLNILALSKRLNIGREEVLLLLVAMENKGLVTWDNCRKVYSPGGTTLEIVKNLTRHFSKPTSPKTTLQVH